MSRLVMVLSCTVILKTDDIEKARAVALALRETYKRYDADLLHGAVVGRSVPAGLAADLQEAEMRQLGEANARGVPVESSNPALLDAFTRAAKARQQ